VTKRSQQPQQLQPQPQPQPQPQQQITQTLKTKRGIIREAPVVVQVQAEVKVGIRQLVISIFLSDICL